jgi:hypothetical protein
VLSSKSFRNPNRYCSDVPQIVGHDISPFSSCSCTRIFDSALSVVVSLPTTEVAAHSALDKIPRHLRSSSQYLHTSSVRLSRKRVPQRESPSRETESFRQFHTSTQSRSAPKSAFVHQSTDNRLYYARAYPFRSPPIAFQSFFHLLPCLSEFNSVFLSCNTVGGEVTPLPGILPTVNIHVVRPCNDITMARNRICCRTQIERV